MRHAIAALVLGSAAVVCASAIAKEARAPDAVQIDYSGFAALTAEVEAYRSTRLVSLVDFNAISAEEDVVILDARSAEAFARGHIRGAVNLPFSDFTSESLARVIGAQDRRVLIYCNNNFLNDVAPVMLKRAPLALNIPTFINLYGYGYRDIYELGDVVDFNDPAVHWVAG